MPAYPVIIPLYHMYPVNVLGTILPKKKFREIIPYKNKKYNCYAVWCSGTDHSTVHVQKQLNTRILFGLQTKKYGFLTLKTL